MCGYHSFPESTPCRAIQYHHPLLVDMVSGNVALLWYYNLIGACHGNPWIHSSKSMPLKLPSALYVAGIMIQTVYAVEMGILVFVV